MSVGVGVIPAVADSPNFETAGDPAAGKTPAGAEGAGAVVGFEEFVTARLAALVAFGRVLSGNTATGEDLTQTVLVKVYPKWHRIAQTNPEAYIRRAMVNTYTSWWRRRRREQPCETPPEPAPPGPDAYATLELRQALWGALQALPHRQRAALVLRFYEQASIAEIAETLGAREGTAKSLVSRGLAALRANTGLTDTAPGDDEPPSRDGGRP